MDLSSMSSTADTAPTTTSSSAWWGGLLNDAVTAYNDRLASQTSIQIAQINAQKPPPPSNVPNSNSGTSVSSSFSLSSKWTIGIIVAVIVGVVFLFAKKRR